MDALPMIHSIYCYCGYIYMVGNVLVQYRLYLDIICISLYQARSLVYLDLLLDLGRSLSHLSLEMPEIESETFHIQSIYYCTPALPI